MPEKKMRIDPAELEQNIKHNKSDTHIGRDNLKRRQNDLRQLEALLEKRSMWPKDLMLSTHEGITQLLTRLLIEPEIILKSEDIAAIEKTFDEAIKRGFTPNERYAGKCALCQHARAHLALNRPDEFRDLAPIGFYKELYG